MRLLTSSAFGHIGPWGPSALSEPPVKAKGRQQAQAAQRGWSSTSCAKAPLIEPVALRARGCACVFTRCVWESAKHATKSAPLQSMPLRLFGGATSPISPFLTATHGRLTLVRGYLKRKSTRNLEDGGPPRWALRWLEVDPPEEDRPEYMLSVYKTSARSKRLNAVSLKKISAVRHDDGLPCAFVVSVGESNYTLLARDAADCDTWVRSLNDAREALSVEPGAQCVAS